MRKVAKHIYWTCKSEECCLSAYLKTFGLGFRITVKKK